jgi:hypothetical protein
MPVKQSITLVLGPGNCMAYPKHPPCKSCGDHPAEFGEYCLICLEDLRGVK